ncbi:hypothetical protein E3N88_36614 [Mikania micrantha]|uniref:Uncharacterized protein n=1 Tax=Mikania micrantha TaxID=192012 RepID=A0A5N6M457_9ASTR|nr:hypothetical protein E3N88_36614 [Mikania micrantha]
MQTIIRRDFTDNVLVHRPVVDLEVRLKTIHSCASTVVLSSPLTKAKLSTDSNEGNASLSSCDSKGFGHVLNDGLPGVGQFQPIAAVNLCPTDTDFQSRGEDSRPPEGKLRSMLLGDDEIDNGKGKHLLLEVDNAPNQVTIDACSFEERKVFAWGNRYGPPHKCPETRSVKWGRINE